MDLLPSGSDDVIHKHMLRDRSDILNERENRNGQGRNVIQSFSVRRLKK